MLTLKKHLKNTECHTGTHTEHLCYMISQGFHISDEQEYKALIDNPEFKCHRCGRTARSGSSLCVPAHL